VQTNLAEFESYLKENCSGERDRKRCALWWCAA
jgi:hypothetical protein